MPTLSRKHPADPAPTTKHPASSAARAPSVGRRPFLRSLTGGALALAAAGAKVLADARPAAAQGTCCGIVGSYSSWCPYTCSRRGAHLVCWSCNNGRCRCCECFQYRTSCFYAALGSGRIYCGIRIGCCN